MVLETILSLVYVMVREVERVNRRVIKLFSPAIITIVILESWRFHWLAAIADRKEASGGTLKVQRLRGTWWS